MGSQQQQQQWRPPGMAPPPSLGQPQQQSQQNPGMSLHRGWMRLDWEVEFCVRMEVDNGCDRAL